MSLNFVRVRWRVAHEVPAMERTRRILANQDLGWAAKGIGCHLAQVRSDIRFPNCVWDGTMAALDELIREGYIEIQEIIDAELCQSSA